MARSLKFGFSWEGQSFRWDQKHLFNMESDRTPPLCLFEICPPISLKHPLQNSVYSCLLVSAWPEKQPHDSFDWLPNRAMESKSWWNPIKEAGPTMEDADCAARELTFVWRHIQDSLYWTFVHDMKLIRQESTCQDQGLCLVLWMEIDLLRIQALPSLRLRQHRNEGDKRLGAYLDKREPEPSTE